MLSFFLVFFLGLLSGVFVSGDPEIESPLSSYEVLMSWRSLNFNFTSKEDERRAMNSSNFIPENNVFTGIKVVGRRIFLVVPRFKEGVPATLVYINYDPIATTPTDPIRQRTNSPPLIPYPDWKSQDLGACSAFQHVQAIETDPFNRLWIADTGFHLNIPNVPHCPPKLVIMDLATDQIILSYNFPYQVVSPLDNLLSEIVVTCADMSDPLNCWAYITDTAGGKLIVFHMRNKQSWAVRHSSMKAINGSPADRIKILGKTYHFHKHITGIAVSPADQDFDRVFYNPLSSYNLYSISSKTLKMAGSSGYLHELDDSEVKIVGSRYSQSDGQIMSSAGLLFYGVLADSAVNYWNSSQVLDSSSEVLFVQNDTDLQWPSAFSFDENGYLYATTNRLQRSLLNNYDLSDVNFRIIRMYVGAKSYQHSVSELLPNNGTHEKILSKEESGSSCRPKFDRRDYATITFITVVVVISLVW